MQIPSMAVRNICKDKCAMAVIGYKQNPMSNSQSRYANQVCGKLLEKIEYLRMFYIVGVTTGMLCVSRAKGP